MTTKTLNQINEELIKLREVKKKLTGSKKRHRVTFYKRLQRVEDSPLDARNKLSHFSKVSHLL